MDASALQPGQIFGRDFRIERRLDAGGMGAVYVATQLSTNRLRALKLMHARLVPDVKSRLRFVDEARIGAQIESEHVVEVVAAGVDEDSGMPWLAMELLEGEDLAAHVARRGPLAPHEVVDLFEQLGHALDAAHTRGIIHRDLKPENLFLARARRQGTDFTLKILDFGIATSVPEAHTAALVTSALGSPLWMAPEQARGGDKVRPATDVWALGLIAYTLLTGRYYWRAAYTNVGFAGLTVEILGDAIDPPSQRAREMGSSITLPPGFDDWFAHCVARDPAHRFQSAGAAIGALEHVLRPGSTRVGMEMHAHAPMPVASSSPSYHLSPSAPAAPVPFSDAMHPHAPHEYFAPQPAPNRTIPMRWLLLAAFGGIAALVFTGASAWSLGVRSSRSEPRASEPMRAVIPQLVEQSAPPAPEPVLAEAPAPPTAPPPDVEPEPLAPPTEDAPTETAVALAPRREPRTQTAPEPPRPIEPSPPPQIAPAPEPAPAPRPRPGMAGTYDGVHPHWRDTVILSADGTYRRGSGDPGRWHMEGNTLVLAWQRWGPERLARVAEGEYRAASNGFTLRRRGGSTREPSPAPEPAPIVEAPPRDPTPESGPEITVVPGDGRCPSGMAPMSLARAEANRPSVCRLLDQWAIARLAGGGSMDGRGYRCQTRASDTRSLGHTICAR